EDGIRDGHVTGVQTCALPIYSIEIRLTVRGTGRAIGLPLSIRWHGDHDQAAGHGRNNRCFNASLHGVRALSLVFPTRQITGYTRSEERRVGKECRSRW